MELRTKILQKLASVGLDQKKRDQHYVWQFYLRSWAVKGSLYVARQGRIFSTGTPRIAFEKDFYRVEKLRPNEISLLRALFIDPSHPIARSTHEQLLGYMTALDGLEGRSVETDRLIDVWRNNSLENYHAAIEGEFIPLLEKARQGDLSFYGDEDGCMNFLRFICVQYFRTKNIKKSVVDALMNFNGTDLTKVWNIACFMCAANLGANLFLERKVRRLLLLRNSTKIPFTTSDQPILNISPKSNGKPTGCILYYPISPEYALLLTDTDGRSVTRAESLTENEIVVFNKQIADASFEMVFSRDKAVLEHMPGA